jgi:hypothetical protein
MKAIHTSVRKLTLRGGAATLLCAITLMAPNGQAKCQDLPEGTHSYRIPLEYTKPQEVLDILRGTLSSSLGPYDWSQALTGTQFIIPNERDSSFLINATPDGFNLLRDIIKDVDVPAQPLPKHTPGWHTVKPYPDPALLAELKKRQQAASDATDDGGIPPYGPGLDDLAGARTYRLHLLNATPRYVLDTLKHTVSSSLHPVTWYHILDAGQIAYLMPDALTNTLILRATPAGYADFKDIVLGLGVTTSKEDTPPIIHSASPAQAP